MQKVKRCPGPEELSSLCSQIALLLNSGMAIYDGMETLAENYKDEPHADMYAQLSAKVNETGTLYEAFKSDDRWPEYLTEMVGIGERSGHLEEVVNGLASYYEREGHIRSAVTSAIIYPIALGIMLVAIVLVMLVKVLPVFKQVLGSMGLGMSDSGNVLMNIGANVGYVVLILVGICILFALACVILLKSKWADKTRSFLMKMFPALNRITKRIAASRVASVLSMMLSSGFPMEEALEMVPAVLGDPEAARRVNRILEAMREGTSFADALPSAGLFDNLHSRMIRMGVAAGREDEVMGKIAALYEEQVQEGIGRLVAIIEPTLVALLAIVVGAVLLAVMLPMAGILSSIL